MKFLVIAVAACAAWAVLPSSVSAQANGTFAVDGDKAKKGRAIFTAKGCNACHTLGKGRSAGPDLAHVTTRREVDWLQRFLKDPPTMLASDPVAMELLKEFKGVKMPNLKLTDEQIDQLLHYVTDASSKLKK